MAMRQTSEWIPKPGTDISKFVRACTVTVRKTKVPVIFHLPGFCPASDMVRADDYSADMSETSHVDSEIILTDRFLDPRIPIDESTGLPLNRQEREEYVAVCEAMLKAGGMASDPRVFPIVDMVKAVGMHARPEDPVTGAKSNSMFLYSTGNVKMKLAYKDGGPYPEKGIFHVVRYYPSYETRIDRIIKRSGEAVRVMAAYMLNPKTATPGFLDIMKRDL